MNEIKSEILNILKEFERFCSNYNIKYTLGYGTLLGAVRHKGFIPWDDDIDVVLTTTEYIKLKKLAKQNKYLDKKHRYSFSIPGDKDYCYSFIKVVDNKYTLVEKNIDERYKIGLYMDVFRVDYWPESPLIEVVQLKYARLLMNLNKVCIRGNIQDEHLVKIDKLLKPVDVLYKILRFRTEGFVSHLEKIGLKNKKSKFIGNIMSGSGRKTQRLDSRIFDEIIRIPFEDTEFPVPKQYDLYLKSIYGDYMQMPPVEKQIGHEYNVISINEKF